jgi:hypothetical protein
LGQENGGHPQGVEDERREAEQPEVDEAELEEEGEVLPPREAMSIIDIGGTLGPPPLTE